MKCMSLFNLTFVGINVYIVPKKQDHKYIIQRHLIKCRKIRKWKKNQIKRSLSHNLLREEVEKDM